MGDTTERDNGTQFLHLSDGWRQEITAGSYFFRRRLVLGWYAAHRIGDPAVNQLKPIVGMGAVFAARKPKLAERVVEQHAGIVASEGAAGPVGTLQAGSEAYDQQARIGGTEGGNRR